jgi:hypothetical protein
VPRRGLPTTSGLRTVVDLGGRNPLTEGVVAADLVLHAGLITMAELRSYVAEHSRAKGIARLRRVVDLAEPKTESAMETRAPDAPRACRTPEAGDSSFNQ